MTAPAVGRREIAASMLAYLTGWILLVWAVSDRNLGELLAGLVFLYMATIDPFRLWRARSRDDQRRGGRGRR